jgi:acetolactate synthase-1/2/3 large subunit
MLGMHGTAYANKAVADSDLIIAIGMRFDDRATGKVSVFAEKAKVVHIDIDPAEIGKNVKVDVPIVGDVKTVLRSLNKQMEPKKHTDWVEKVDDWRREHPMCFDERHEGILPQMVISKICQITKGKAIVVTGVGQNQMWSAQHYCYDCPGKLISSGGLGTMGYELPAAFGAKIGRPKETVWCVAGDGGFQMTMQELGTIVQERAAVKIAILNNGFLGMVRQWQELFYGKRYVATPLLGPDFSKVAAAYGIPALEVKEKEEVVPAIEKAMAEKGPFLLDFHVEPEENVYPMVPSGAAIDEIIHPPKKGGK